MPIVHDLARHCPGIAIDWVAEEPFAGLVALNRGVRRVIPVALRRWRHHVLARATWREFGAFRRQLGARSLHRGDRSAGAGQGRVARVARARAGARPRSRQHSRTRCDHRVPSAASHRSAAASDRSLPAARRCRVRLSNREGPPQFDLVPPPAARCADRRATRSFCTRPAARTSCGRESHWSALIEHFTAAGFTVVLPWGSADEAARSAALAAGIADALVPPHRSLPEARGAARARRAGVRRRHRTDPPGRGTGRADDLAFRRHRSAPRRRRACERARTRSGRHRHRADAR